MLPHYYYYYYSERRKSPGDDLHWRKIVSRYLAVKRHPAR